MELTGYSLNSGSYICDEIGEDSKGKGNDGGNLSIGDIKAEELA